MLVLRSRSSRTAAAHFLIGLSGHHHRHSSAVRSLSRGQDSVLPVFLGLHQSSSAQAELHVQIQFSWMLIVLMLFVDFKFMHAHPEAYGS
jgi:hypothetical protein